jgi:hypothetical protein
MRQQRRRGLARRRSRAQLRHGVEDVKGGAAPGPARPGCGGLVLRRTGGLRASPPVAARWRRIFFIKSGSVMNPIIRIVASHRGQKGGSRAYMRRRSSARRPHSVDGGFKGTAVASYGWPTLPGCRTVLRSAKVRKVLPIHNWSLCSTQRLQQENDSCSVKRIWRG